MKPIARRAAANSNLKSSVRFPSAPGRGCVKTRNRPPEFTYNGMEIAAQPSGAEDSIPIAQEVAAALKRRISVRVWVVGAGGVFTQPRSFSAGLCSAAPGQTTARRKGIGRRRFPVRTKFGRGSHNPWVPGSSPGGPTKLFRGLGYPRGRPGDKRSLGLPPRAVPGDGNATTPFVHRPQTSRLFFTSGRKCFPGGKP
jgi:hypothetical protein